MSLWLPEHAGELLSITVDAEADFDSEEFQGMLTINAAGFDWLGGKLDSGTYFDILDHYGIDPIPFVDEVEKLYTGR